MEIDLLLFIAEQAGLYGQMEGTTISLAKSLGFSQQTASRKLIEMEENGLIERNSSVTGFFIKLTEEGRKYLKIYQDRLINIFSVPLEISGKVVDGLGEGKFYMSKEGYRRQFIEKLGFDPYPGTLNAKCDELERDHFIGSRKKTRIEGFTSEERTFGPLNAIKVEIEGIRCAIIVPERTTHKRDVIEVISPANLRNKLKSQDVVIRGTTDEK